MEDSKHKSSKDDGQPFYGSYPMPDFPESAERRFRRGELRPGED